ncbi:MAG: hypothetical protein A2621_01520 [Alphaproteobacteria bacterium RIFCSPHIGHO2_01_FULL_41_14]|nr:MAG: hypothetical protein A3K20_02780 [Alphaproteobacteria bacterium GWA1_45_9]OFW90108.1 MAG: hypothetical protein A2621_01520 [Alphaproteobacteria bacterium RIFCSPHIGHO2_01_FULL_41_14]
MEISPQQLAEIFQQDPHLFMLDVREPWEVKKVSLKGAVNIPLSDLIARQTELPLERPLYVVCHHGVRSLKVALFLREQGYEAYSLKGGIDAWARDVDPSVGFY